jgi:hypothetical protein
LTVATIKFLKLIALILLLSIASFTNAQQGIEKTWELVVKKMQDRNRLVLEVISSLSGSERVEPNLLKDTQHKVGLLEKVILLKTINKEVLGEISSLNEDINASVKRINDSLGSESDLSNSGNYLRIYSLLNSAEQELLSIAKDYNSKVVSNHRKDLILNIKE